MIDSILSSIWMIQKWRSSWMQTTQNYNLKVHQRIKQFAIYIRVSYVYYFHKISKVGNRSQRWPFSITITPKCREGCYFFPRIAPLYPWYISYNAEYWARRYQVPFFLAFGMTRPEIEPQSPGPLANTIANRPVHTINSLLYAGFSGLNENIVF